VHYRTTIRQSSGCMTTTGHRLVAAQRPQSRRGDDRHQHAGQPETPSVPRKSLDQDAVLPRAWSCRTAFARIAWCSPRRRCLRDATASPHPGQHRSRAPLLAAATTASSPPRLTRAVTGPERRRGRGSHPTRPINFVEKARHPPGSRHRRAPADDRDHGKCILLGRGCCGWPNMVSWRPAERRPKRMRGQVGDERVHAAQRRVGSAPPGAAGEGRGGHRDRSATR
jgi:hypothetical protein